jgi:hypothetical protein
VKLSRRSFLVSLSAAVAALTLKTLDPEIPILQGLYEPEKLIWTPDDARELVLPARVALASDRSLIHMTKDVLRLLEQELGPGFTALMTPARDARLGHTVLVHEARPFAVTPPAFDVFPDITMTVRPVTLDWIRVHEVPLPPIEAWARARTNYRDFEHAQLRMVAHDFARTIRQNRLNVFGEQDLPMGSDAARVMSNSSGLAVRGVKMYDIGDAYRRPGDYVHFDILGGHA